MLRTFGLLVLVWASLTVRHVHQQDQCSVETVLLVHLLDDFKVGRVHVHLKELRDLIVVGTTHF